MLSLSGNWYFKTFLCGLLKVLELSDLSRWFLRWNNHCKVISFQSLKIHKLIRTKQWYIFLNLKKKLNFFKLLFWKGSEMNSYFFLKVARLRKHIPTASYGIITLLFITFETHNYPKKHVQIKYCVYICHIKSSLVQQQRYQTPYFIKLVFCNYLT